MSKRQKEEKQKMKESPIEKRKENKETTKENGRGRIQREANVNGRTINGCKRKKRSRTVGEKKKKGTR